MTDKALHSPKSIHQLKQALETVTPESKIIAGGTDLIIEIHYGKCVADKLLYIGGVKELTEITEDKHEISIGAAATMQSISKSPIILANLTAIADGAGDVGSAQIRNNATIGGNIANASPAADLLPCLWLFGAEVELLSPKGTRILPIDQFVLGAGKTDLSYNEVITRFIIKKSMDNCATAFVKVGSRRKVTISRLGVGISVNRDTNKSRIVLGAVATTPIFANQAETMLTGNLEAENLFVVGDELTRLILEINKRSNREYKAWAIKGGLEDACLLIKERL